MDNKKRIEKLLEVPQEHPIKKNCKKNDYIFPFVSTFNPTNTSPKSKRNL